MDLVLDAPLKCEAVFLLDLPDLRSYRSILERIQRLADRGAVFMILRTGNLVVVRHLMQYAGVLPTVRQADGRSRYLVPPAAFRVWLKKWS